MITVRSHRGQGAIDGRSPTAWHAWTSSRAVRAAAISVDVIAARGVKGATPAASNAPFAMGAGGGSAAGGITTASGAGARHVEHSPRKSEFGVLQSRQDQRA